MLSFKILASEIIPEIRVLNDLTIIGDERKAVAVQLYDSFTKNPVYLPSGSSAYFRFYTTVDDQSDQILEIQASINERNPSIISASLSKNQTLLITGKQIIVKYTDGIDTFVAVRDRVLNKIQYETNIIHGDEIENLQPEIIIEGDTLEILENCLNSTGATLEKGSITFLTGNDNNEIALAKCNGTENEAYAIGIVVANILNGGSGVIQTGGTFAIDLPFANGAELYLGESGNLVDVCPSNDGDYQVFIGTYTEGELSVRIDVRGRY